MIDICKKIMVSEETGAGDLLNSRVNIYCSDMIVDFPRDSTFLQSSDSLPASNMPRRQTQHTQQP